VTNADDAASDTGAAFTPGRYRVSISSNTDPATGPPLETAVKMLGIAETRKKALVYFASGHASATAWTTRRQLTAHG